ncbi:2-methoxy-6-polyprenyl-1,4-benzoquinol methylase, mitochondrial [Halomonadaceae bacterium LMG 33818]|uniref:methyltransferase domain-containing protein n=1 Tax=Cernens ardua TaxID=3402176 RepID=UPI003EDB7220
MVITRSDYGMPKRAGFCISRAPELERQLRPCLDGKQSMPMNSAPLKHEIARNFGHASVTYDAASFLQQWIAVDLLQKVAELSASHTFNRALDVGCGTGYVFRQAKCQHIDIEEEYGLDLSAGMLQAASHLRPQARWIQGDIEALPFGHDHFPLITSNLAVQWLDSLDIFLSEAYRVMTPGGILAFSTLGPDTLKELTRVRERAGLKNTVNPTLLPQQLANSIKRAPFTTLLSVRQPYLYFYDDAVTLSRALKQLGAHHCRQAQQSGLSGRKKWQQLRAQSKALYPEGIPARYDTYLVVLQKPDNTLISYKDGK